MSNMSYCRWQNTASDLRDCALDLEERMQGGTEEDAPRPLSWEEARARERLMRTAAEMFEQLGVDVDIEAAIEQLKEVL